MNDKDKWMTRIIITINDHDIEGFCDAAPSSPEIERKCAAILMAANDAIVSAMGPEGDVRGVVKALIQPTIEKRKREAFV